MHWALTTPTQRQAVPICAAGFVGVIRRGQALGEQQVRERVAC